ncbi:hypothetical protein LCGC14_2140380 [marine sediment metagenome]|uniref:Uncharacterized protein n=1 Tax=marine sediment metagenome TaxID=412755 RepID=A0A0F9DYU7_9ZZZZ
MAVVMKIVSVGEDHLACHTWDWDSGVEGTTELLVAKRWLLRRSPFDPSMGGSPRDGIEYTYISNQERDADTGTEVVREIVVPRFVAADVIEAEPAPIGGTGVTVTAPVPWQMLSDGRMWAQKYGS